MSIESLPKYLFSSIILCNLNSRLVSKKFKEVFDFGCKIYIWDKVKDNKEATDNLKNRMNLLEKEESNGFLLIRKFFEPSRKIKFDNFFLQMQEFQKLEDLSIELFFSGLKRKSDPLQMTASQRRDWLSKEEIQKQLPTLKQMKVSIWGADIIVPKELTLLTGLNILNIDQGSSKDSVPMDSVFSGEVSFFPKGLNLLQGLTELTCVRQKRLAFLHEDFYKLTNLTTLQISGSEISTFSEEFGNLKNLTDLELTHNKKLSSLPEFKNFTNLTNLKINFMPITFLPEGFCNLKSLKELDINYNENLSLFPEDFGNLVSLKKIVAEKCNLSSLPDSMSRMTQLMRLNLSCNKFNSFLLSIKEIFGPVLCRKHWNTFHGNDEFKMFLDLRFQNGYYSPSLPWEENKN